MAPTIPARMRPQLTFKANRGIGRHGWLRLTPAYGVRLVEQIAESLDHNDVVLDPFCGTGTTALVCAERGMTADTVDINPFLTWLTQVKCDFYAAADCEAASLVRINPHGGTHWTPPIHDIKKWWEAPILAKLANICHQIQTAKVGEKPRNLLKAAFCRLVVRTANVTFGHQSMSFKKNLAAANGELNELLHWEFETILRETVAGAMANPKTTPRVLLGDSRALETLLPKNRYSAVITSPPYPNRMSYVRELRPYMYWLGFLENARQASELDWRAIGGTWGAATSNLGKWVPDLTVPSDGFYETIDSIKKGASPILAPYVHKYFVDTVHHLRGLKPCMKSGGRLFYVVGNSKFYGTMLHTEEIYASILRAEGFVDIQIENIRKRSSKKELFEFIVKARKRI
jgi:hypothetical protein